MDFIGDILLILIIIAIRVLMVIMVIIIVIIKREMDLGRIEKQS